MSLDTLPRDVMIHEILPKLRRQELFNIGKTFPNIKYRVIEEIIKRMKNDVPFDATERIRSVSDPSILPVKREINAEPFNGINLYKEIKHNFIVRADAPGVITVIGYLDHDIGVIPLTLEQINTALNMGLRVENVSPLVDWELKYLKNKPAIFTLDLRKVIKYINDLLDDIITLQVDDKTYSLSKSGFIGFLLGLCVSDMLSKHTVKLHNIAINNLNVVFFLYNEPQKWYIRLNGSRYYFSDTDFISNLKVSNVKPDKNEFYRRGGLYGEYYEIKE